MPGRLSIVVMAAVAVLIGAEAGARVLDDHLPAPRTWHSVEAQQKVAQMDALAGTGVDVALVGTSVVNGGLDPQLLAERLDRTVYNAALSAGTPLLMEAWTSSVVLPRVRPDVVVYGLISFDFYGHPSQEAFRDAFADSPAGSRALDGERFTDRVDRWVGEVSSLWKDRNALRDPGTVIDALRGITDEPEAEFGPIGPAGRAHYGARPPIAVDAPDEATQAGLPVEDWRIDDAPVDAVRSLIREARAAGSTMVLVAMPVSQTYVDRLPHGEADEQEFLDALRHLAADEGVVLLDHENMRDPSRYLDQVHLDDAGAAELSALLADELSTVLAAV